MFAFVTRQHTERGSGAEKHDRKEIVMKKMFALAAMISASTLTAGAYAQDTTVTAPAPGAADVSVVNISKPPVSGSGNTAPAKTSTATPEVAQAAQAQIQSDPSLQAAIREKNVQVENVVAVETTGNGAKVIYVK
jgi:hypothetical protein